MGVEETVSKVIVYHRHPSIGSFVRLTNGQYIIYYKDDTVEVGLGAPSLEKEYLGGLLMREGDEWAVCLTEEGLSKQEIAELGLMLANWGMLLHTETPLIQADQDYNYDSFVRMTTAHMFMDMKGFNDDDYEKKYGKPVTESTPGELARMFNITNELAEYFLKSVRLEREEL